MKFIMILALISIIICGIFSSKNLKKIENNEKQNPCGPKDKFVINVTFQQCKNKSGKYHFYPKSNSVICCISNKSKKGSNSTNEGKRRRRSYI